MSAADLPFWKTSRETAPLGFGISQPACFLAKRDNNQVALNGENPFSAGYVGELCKGYPLTNFSADQG
ncbi:unnamed protein product [Prunus armeniaca]